jgi:hypothetical protein
MPCDVTTAGQLRAHTEFHSALTALLWPQPKLDQSRFPCVSVRTVALVYSFTCDSIFDSYRRHTDLKCGGFDGWKQKGWMFDLYPVFVLDLCQMDA